LHTSQQPLPEVAFDDRVQLAHGGLILVAQLARRLDLAELFRKYVDLGQRAGRARVAEKAMTLVASMLVGGDSIDDTAVVKQAGMEEVLGQRLLAPSTLGTFLRAFTWGHSRQLEKVLEEALVRAWRLAPAAPEEVLKLDIDTTITETYGKYKQGTQRGHGGAKGYAPYLASIEAGELVHCRLRGGNASPSRGAGKFVKESLARVRRAGHGGGIVVRADSGFYCEEVVHACGRYKANFSITVRRFEKVRSVMEAIPEEDWREIAWADGRAGVAEAPYLAFANSHRKGQHRAVEVRLIARRVVEERRDRPWLPGMEPYRYHAFITDREGGLVELEADHRQHARIENEVRELKYDLALNHLPSGRFAANAVWLVLNVLAHNLAYWVVKLGLQAERAMTAKTLRLRYLNTPGRIVRSGRQTLLKMPRTWPWAREFRVALQRLSALGLPAPAAG